MSTATNPQQNENQDQSAAERNVPLPLRGDTLLGVCEAVGEDLGFNPTWLRLAFAVLLMWNPEVVVACYLGLGVVVALTRWFFPVRKRVTVREAAPETVPAAVNVDAKVEEKELLAA